MVVCEQQRVARGMFVTVTSTAGATELAGLFGESPWKDTKIPRIGQEYPVLCHSFLFSSQWAHSWQQMFVTLHWASVYGYRKISTEGERGKKDPAKLDLTYMTDLK